MKTDWARPVCASRRGAGDSSNTWLDFRQGPAINTPSTRSARGYA